MAKLMNMFVVLIAIQICLLMYTKQTPENNVIWLFVTTLSAWGTGGLILGIVGIASGIGLVGVAAASQFGFKTDFLIFAPAIAGFISCGTVLTNLASVMRDDLISSVFPACSIAAPLSVACGPVNIVLAVFPGILALYYVITILSWWRGQDY